MFNYYMYRLNNSVDLKFIADQHEITINAWGWYERRGKLSKAANQSFMFVRCNET